MGETRDVIDVKIERDVIVKFPSDMELSEEEKRKIVAAAENEIIDVIKGERAEQLAAKVIDVHISNGTETVIINPKESPKTQIV